MPPQKQGVFFCSGAEAFVHSVFADLFFSQAISPSGEISDSSDWIDCNELKDAYFFYRNLSVKEGGCPVFITP